MGEKEKKRISNKGINKREPLLTRLRLGNKIFIGYLRNVGKNR